MTLKFKFASYDSGFVRGCIGGSIEAQRKVQTPAQEMNGVIEGELEACKAMFMGSPLSLEGEKDALHRRNRTPPLGNVGGDAMSRGLCQISRSPSSGYIEDAELPCQFT